MTMSVALARAGVTEIRRTRFEIPEGFESLRFWPLGHDGTERDPVGKDRIERLLVVSQVVKGFKP